MPLAPLPNRPVYGSPLVGPMSFLPLLFLISLTKTGLFGEWEKMKALDWAQEMNVSIRLQSGLWM